MHTKTVKKFSDFAEEPKLLDGDKVKIDDVLNREICITGYKVRDSTQKKGTKCLTLQFMLEDRTRILFTGSTVLIDQVEKYRDEIPFLTVVKKIDRYFTLT